MTQDRTLRFLGDLFPPLAPPLGSDQDPELLVPAIGDLLVRLDVIPAVLTLFLARGVSPRTALSARWRNSIDSFSSISLGSGSGMT